MDNTETTETLVRQAGLLNEGGGSTDIGVGSKVYTGSFCTNKPVSRIIFESLQQIGSC